MKIQDLTLILIILLLCVLILFISVIHWVQSLILKGFEFINVYPFPLEINIDTNKVKVVSLFKKSMIYFILLIIIVIKFILLIYLYNIIIYLYNIMKNNIETVPIRCIAS